MTTTGNAPKYSRLNYKITNEVKSYSVYQFEPQNDLKTTTNLLTDVLRIEVFNNKSKATNINEYLRLRTTTNWAKCEMVTGLRPTANPTIFYGDRIVKNTKGTGTRELLIFHFEDNKKTLLIDVYNGFYPNHKGILTNILKSY